MKQFETALISKKKEKESYAADFSEDFSTHYLGSSLFISSTESKSLGFQENFLGAWFINVLATKITEELPIIFDNRFYFRHLSGNLLF